jgi:antitoxin VapB
MSDKAKILRSNGSQVVLLPSQYRFDTAELRIRRHGDALILEPIAKDWKWLDAVTGPLDEDFLDALRSARAEASTR